VRAAWNSLLTLSLSVMAQIALRLLLPRWYGSVAALMTIGWKASLVGLREQIGDGGLGHDPLLNGSHGNGSGSPVLPTLVSARSTAQGLEPGGNSCRS
jgi:hypothetical protein